MAHHKRGRAKNRRAGCLFCKPHKANGAKDRHPRPELVSRISTAEQVHGDPYESVWDDYEDLPCDCSACCEWEESLKESSAYLPTPIKNPIRLEMDSLKPGD